MVSSEVKLMMKLLIKNKVSFAGFIIVLTFIFVGILAPFITPYPADARGWVFHMNQRLLPPSWKHPFGTDEFGRDMLSRVILGSRYSLIISVSVIGLALLIGVPIGLVAGYLGGKVGSALMRIADMFLAFPPLLLAVAMAATLGRGLRNVIISLAISWWPWYTRLMYVQTNSIKTMPYIDAAKVLGLRTPTILFKHILPNAITPVMVQAALDMGSAILEAAGLSFLGVGVKPPTPEWGLLVTEGWASINRAWWISLFPGLAILITVLGFNLMADGLREITDPRLRRLLISRGGRI